MVVKKLKGHKSVENIERASIKAAFVVLYYVLAGVIGQLSHTYYEANRERILGAILCSSTGSMDCEDLKFGTAARILGILSVVMLAFMPVVALLFSFNPKVCRKERE